MVGRPEDRPQRAPTREKDLPTTHGEFDILETYGLEDEPTSGREREKSLLINPLEVQGIRPRF